MTEKLTSQTNATCQDLHASTCKKTSHDFKYNLKTMPVNYASAM